MRYILSFISTRSGMGDDDCRPRRLESTFDADSDEEAKMKAGEKTRAISAREDDDFRFEMPDPKTFGLAEQPTPRRIDWQPS